MRTALLLACNSYKNAQARFPAIWKKAMEKTTKNEDKTNKLVERKP